MFWKNRSHGHALNISSCSPSELQLLCLIAAGGMEFLLLALGSLLGGVMYYYVENYFLLPCGVFLGVTLTQKLTAQTKRQMLLCLGMVAWFVITQSQHKIYDGGYKHAGMFLTVYLLAFPFASVTQDGVGQKGLKWVARLFLGAAAVLVLYTLLLLQNMLPAGLRPYVMWDGARLLAMWHPNICACLFMIGIALCLGFSFQARKRWQKGLLLAGAAVLFVCLALTNCRTSILMTCAMVGCIAAFAIGKAGGKRIILAVAVAPIVAAALFLTSSTLYRMHNQNLIDQYIEQGIIEQVPDSTPDQTEKPQGVNGRDQTEKPQGVNAQKQTVKLQGVNGQGTLSNDMRTLNGRTKIWASALRSLGENRSLLLWGTEYSGLFASRYNPFEVDHTHNSWMEILLRMGLPGLVFALIFTGLAVRDALVLMFQSRDMWKTCVSLLVLCLLVAGFLEPFLFCVDISYHFLDFFFFTCLGYLEMWYQEEKAT